MVSLRVVILAGLLAASTAALMLATRWRARAQANPTPAASVSILDRRVASVHLHGVPVMEAVGQLQDLIGTKISARWDLLEKHKVGSETIWLDFDDVPVGQLMLAFTEQLRGYREAATFDVQDNVIVIAPDVDMKRTFRVYDVSDLAKDHPTVTLPCSDYSRAIRFCLEERYWYCGALVSRQSEWLHQDSSRLLVLQTAPAHAQIATFLAALRQARPDGSGPCISRSRVLEEKSATTMVCFYDVRDLADRAIYENDGVDKKFTRSGDEALVFLVSSQRCTQHWLDKNPHNFQACSVAGRLIVELPPAAQLHVRQTLDEIRAGKPFPGFRLKPPPAHLQ